MTLDLKKYVANITAMLLLLIVIHVLLFRAATTFVGVTLSIIIQIYGFLWILNIVHFIGLKWLFLKWAKQAGFIFTGISLLKMGLAILFLFPYIFPSNESSAATAINFMTIYLFTLAYEVLFLVKNMTKDI